MPEPGSNSSFRMRLIEILQRSIERLEGLPDDHEDFSSHDADANYIGIKIHDFHSGQSMRCAIRSGHIINLAGINHIS